MSTTVPLCVDLDGTLLNTDLLLESAFAQLKRRPLAVIHWPRWLAAGKARLKAELAARAELDIETLPYHSAFLEFLREQRERGRPLVLVTAAHRSLAEQVAAHLGLFERVIATDGHCNLAGARKAETLVALYGERGFDYAGNAAVDAAVWRHSRRAIAVNTSAEVTALARASAELERVFADKGSRLKRWLRAARLHQWLKNVLIFVPLVAAHAWNDAEKVGFCLLAFLSFGSCASSVYLLNDLLDLAADRRHPRKCRRPFAAGALPILHGAVAVPVLLTAALLLSLAVNPPEFSACLAVYYVLTLAYSLRLKQVLMLDAIVLAGLYTLRIITGAVAAQLALSFWMLAFSMFLFLSLALVKRYTELHALARRGELDARGRGYQVADLAILQSLGGSAGYLAVLVLALYINSPEVQHLYRHPLLIGFFCPLLLYWISRVWLLAHRGLMPDDPVIFALTDRVSQGLVLIGALVLWSAL
ncbi:MAG TPA: UbiA family prenyltransferase [Candidatus Competibacter sp.]|nr:UbiA family prenyltransferase [Candidatus Competibacteraceae bacterium]HRC72317.1 UbiA family prenyltransferase [Candidatus Competibacter sp.]